MCHQRDFPIWIRPVVRKAEKGVKKNANKRNNKT